MNIKITGSGSFIPENIEKNEDFHQHEFLNVDGSEINSPNEIIVEKFSNIQKRVGKNREIWVGDFFLN